MTPLDELLAASRGRLTVDADLAIEVDGRRAHLTGSGHRLHLELTDGPSRRDIAAIRGTPMTALRQVAASLAAVGLTVDVASADGVVARVGDDAEPGVAARLVGAPVSIGPGGTRPLRRVALAVLAAIVAFVLVRRRAR